MSETQDLIEGNGTRPVISGTVGHSTLVSNKQWIVIQVGLQPRSQGLFVHCFLLRLRLVDLF